MVSVSALSSPKMPLDKANAVTNERGRLGARAAVTSVPVATKSVVCNRPRHSSVAVSCTYEVRGNESGIKKIHVDLIV